MKSSLIVKLFMLFVVLVLSFGMVSASGYHIASELLSGNFSTGNFNFDGNVGIGVTSPDSALAIAGNISVSADSSFSIGHATTQDEWSTIQLDLNATADASFIASNAGDYAGADFDVA